LFPITTGLLKLAVTGQKLFVVDRFVAGLITSLLQTRKKQLATGLLEQVGTRLLARRASRRPGTPQKKMDAFVRPNSGGKGKLFSIISLSILIYLKRNSFNSHYYYAFDNLINLKVYLAE
jgi:hypothetical protein